MDGVGAGEAGAVTGGRGLHNLSTTRTLQGNLPCLKVDCQPVGCVLRGNSLKP